LSGWPPQCQRNASVTRGKGRSLEAELREVLTRAAKPNLDEFRKLAAAIRARHEGMPQTDSVQLLREERDPVRLVVDASVAMKWFVPEPLAAGAEGLLSREHGLLAPDVLLIECANIIWKKARRGEMLRAAGDEALVLFRNSGIELIDTQPLVEPALRLARELDHPVHDCLYVAAAAAMDGVAVTADRRFFARTRKGGAADRLQWLGSFPA
jgi:predicted nucleic acid-binding protein/plasmid stability protein